jgi:hypothetical protein
MPLFDLGGALAVFADAVGSVKPRQRTIRYLTYANASRLG